MFIPNEGAVIAGRYKLARVIARGGMGEVWEARDQELENPCAIKFILEHLARDPALRTRFTREAKTVARLRSPHVVHILGVGEHEGTLYLAMELLEGETLQTRLTREGILTPELTFALVEQVGHALQKAHDAGIVHRDLKPDNIWLWSERDMFAKVIDFGVAKSQQTPQSVQTVTGALVGTPHYMSPEQANGTREVDHRSDLWALGIITIQCLTGKRPFDSEGLGDLLIQIVSKAPPRLSELAPGLPPALQGWWERALARKPDQRFQAATELVQGLKPHLVPQSMPWSSPLSNPLAGDTLLTPAPNLTSPTPISTASSASAAPAVGVKHMAPVLEVSGAARVLTQRYGVGSMSPMAHTRSPRLKITPGKLWALGGAAAVGLGLFAVLALTGALGKAPRAPRPAQSVSIAASTPPALPAPLESPTPPPAAAPTAPPVDVAAVPAASPAALPAASPPSAVQVAATSEPSVELQPSGELQSPEPPEPNDQAKPAPSARSVPPRTLPARPRRPAAKPAASKIEEKYGF